MTRATVSLQSQVWALTLTSTHCYRYETTMVECYSYWLRLRHGLKSIDIMTNLFLLFIPWVSPFNVQFNRNMWVNTSRSNYRIQIHNIVILHWTPPSSDSYAIPCMSRAISTQRCNCVLTMIWPVWLAKAAKDVSKMNCDTKWTGDLLISGKAPESNCHSSQTSQISPRDRSAKTLARWIRSLKSIPRNTDSTFLRWLQLPSP